MSKVIDRLYEQMLVVRFLAGDEEAFVELVERYDGRLRSYLRGLSIDACQVEDVLQEVWLTAFRRLSTVRQLRALHVWLLRVARNAALAELRRRRAVVPLETEPASPHPAKAEPRLSPEEVRRIHTCLDRLPRHHREVIMLRISAELSYEDIATVVGAPVGTVRSRIHHAKRALRRELRG